MDRIRQNEAISDIYRVYYYLLTAAAWEKIGQVPNVVFVEGMIDAPRLLFYYGAADQFIGFAEAKYAE